MLTLQPDKRFIDSTQPQQDIKVGSRIQFGKEYGVITWIGTLPGYEETHVKIETVSCITQRTLM